jgi:NitT/TauT family transport system substrate-binding protein
MRIRLAENFRAIFYAPLYAGRALGFHAAEGVEIEWLGAAPGGGAPRNLQTVATIVAK